MKPHFFNADFPKIGDLLKDLLSYQTKKPRDITYVTYLYSLGYNILEIKTMITIPFKKEDIINFTNQNQ